MTGIVELADPENHTMEPKITTLSYIQPELLQFKGFPIETMLFFRIFTKIQLNMKFHFCNPQKALPCAEPRRYFDALSVKIHAGVSAVGEWKNQKSSKHASA